MSPLAARILLTLVIEGLKQLRRYYKNLTPEQQAEFHKAMLECKDPMGGPADGSGP